MYTIMKILYGIEPDLCIVNTQLLTDFTKDLILPSFFHTQLTHLKNGNFQTATDAALSILNSLNKHEQLDAMIFNTVAGGTVYFIDETNQYININNRSDNLDIRNLLDRYLLSLRKLSETLEARVAFFTSSTDVIKKCRSLNFDIVTLEEFTTLGESWSQPEMLVDKQESQPDVASQLDPLSSQEQLIFTKPEQSTQVQWHDIRVVNDASGIQWINTTLNT